MANGKDKKSTGSSSVWKWFSILALVAVVAQIALFGKGAEKRYGTIIQYAVGLIDKGWIPEGIIRIGIDLLLQDRIKEINTKFTENSNYLQQFILDLNNRAIAEQTDKANEQHYEVDTSFYDFVLGKHKKYSSTLYDNDNITVSTTSDIGIPSNTLNDALTILEKSETDMLDLYIKRANLCTGNDCRLNVLDLGCGWGSFTLYYAKLCPNCKITFISNSQTQINYITQQGKTQGFKNINGKVFNINNIEQLKKELISENESFNGFDFIISVEMFEHMKNYKKLLSNISNNLLNSKHGKLFVHIFVHKLVPYHYIIEDDSDWMTKYFFSGGTMPSYNLLPNIVSMYPNEIDLKLIKQWKVNGVHYSYTLETWLDKMKKNEKDVRMALSNIYGKSPDTIEMWWNRWKVFFIACSQLFKYDNGQEWFIGHYLFEKGH